MGIKRVSVTKAKQHFEALLAEVEQAGESVLICRNGRPVARLVPHVNKNRLKPHPVLSRIKIHYDPVEGADEQDWPSQNR